MSKTATYSLIASYTIPSNTASYTFSSIPQTFTDLVIVGQTGYNANNYYTEMYFNGSTANDYSGTYVGGNGSTASSSRRTNYPLIPFDDISAGNTSVQTTSICSIFDYANTTTYKTVLVRDNNPVGSAVPGVCAGVGMWRSTAAITSISLRSSNVGQLITGSTFKLYGIQAGSN
jgi:hypothetical protein